MLSISWIGSFLINHEEYVEAQEPKNYILRSREKKPSSEELGTEYDVPTLKFARIMLGDMIPDILSSDDSPCDAILQPYILQTHLHGQNLCRIWNSLTFSHKKSAMYIVVGLMKQLQTIQYPKAGLIAAANRLVHAPGRIALEVHTFTTSHGPAPVLARAANSPAVSVTTRQFLLDQSRRWQLLERYGVDSNETIWNCFDIITQFLYDMDFIPDDDKFYFCHLDLYARNLLVVVEHDSSLSLTGLLDWDAQFAHSCPKFVAYRASFWLLVSSGNGHNEMKVADKPKDADYRRLKSLWEEAASDEWRQSAYKSEYMIARRLFALLRDSIHHDGDKEEARSIIDEWQKLYNDQRLAAAYANDEIIRMMEIRLLDRETEPYSSPLNTISSSMTCWMNMMKLERRVSKGRSTVQMWLEKTCDQVACIQNYTLILAEDFLLRMMHRADDVSHSQLQPEAKVG